MDIKTSLAITERHLGVICLIRAGTFVRVYNQSYYLLTKTLAHSLKPIINRVKSADNRVVIYGGFPAKLVESYYPNATNTLWGYKITGDFDLTGYHNWLIGCEAQASMKLASGSTAASLPASAEPKSLTQTLIPFNDQQIAFLQAWQKGLYPIEVEQGFIESMKQLVDLMTKGGDK